MRWGISECVLVLLVLVLELQHTVNCFMSTNLVRVASRNSRLTMVQLIENGVNLSGLTNYESDSEFISSSINSWLDEEYVVQSIHSKIGILCGKIYLSGRKRGIIDLGEMLMEVGIQLEKTNFEDAFVNCWDVANKVSDLLMVRMNRELCECAGDMAKFSNSTVTVTTLRASMERLSSEFERYRLLQQLLEGEVSLKTLQPVLAICLGFRDELDAQSGTISMKQVQALAPLCWENFISAPDLANLLDKSLDERLADDLPEESGGVDIALETLVGLEYYKLIKKSADEDMQRRILVTKWLYAMNFFNEFPHKRRFTPKHLEFRLE